MLNVGSCESPAPPEGTLARNLELLKRRWPDVGSLVEQASTPAGATVSPARSGEPTAKLVTDAGAEVWLHSRYRPLEEAARQIADVDLGSNDSLIILGCGLGYATVEAARRAPSTCHIVLVEKDAALVRLACENVELEDFLKRPEVDLIVGATAEELFRRLEQNVNRLLGGAGLKLLAHPASTQTFVDYYEEVLRGIRDFTRHGSVTLRSALYLSRVTIENQFGNLPEYIRSPGVAALANRFRGYPAVVVAAGPSLESNVEELRRAQGKAVILAVSTAMKILLGRGIQPDLTAIIDYHNVSARYFESVRADHAAPIVCDPKANTQAIEAYPGVKLFGNDALMNTLLDGVPGDKGNLAASATVAHAAFDIACTLGCDPIITVGLDLSYPRGRHHAAGTAQQQQHFSETNRFYTFEMQEMEWYLLYRKQLLEVPGIDGGTVWTSDVFFAYLREFEMMFESCPRKVIDATEGGARKRFTEVMRLGEALDIHARADLPYSVSEIASEAAATVDAEDLSRRAECAIKEQLEEARQLASLYSKSIRLLKKMVKVTGNGRNADDLVLQILPLKEKFQQHGFLYYLLNHFAQADLFLRVQDDREIEGEKLSGVEKQHRQARRDLQYVQGLEYALEFVTKQLRAVRRQLRERVGETSVVE